MFGASHRHCQQTNIQVRRQELDDQWVFYHSGAGFVKYLVWYRFVVKYPKKRGTKYLSLCLELSRGNLSKVDKAWHFNTVTKNYSILHNNWIASIIFPTSSGIVFRLECLSDTDEESCIPLTKRWCMGETTKDIIKSIHGRRRRRILTTQFHSWELNWNVR